MIGVGVHVEPGGHVVQAAQNDVVAVPLVIVQLLDPADRTGRTSAWGSSSLARSATASVLCRCALVSSSRKNTHRFRLERTTRSMSTTVTFLSSGEHEVLDHLIAQGSRPHHQGMSPMHPLHVQPLDPARALPAVLVDLARS